MDSELYLYLYTDIGPGLVEDVSGQVLVLVSSTVKFMIKTRGKTG